MRISRRKILVGAVVLSLVEKGRIEEAVAAVAGCGARQER